MKHYPKDYVKEHLDTVILVAIFTPIDMEVLTPTAHAHKKIFITSADLPVNDRHLNFFDVIHIMKDNTDHEGVKEMLKPHITNPKLTRVALLNCLDNPLVTDIREHFDIPGPRFKDIETIISKDLGKKLFAKNGIKTPKHLIVDKEAYKKDSKAYAEYLKQELGMPMFGKRTFSSSGYGYCKIFSDEDLDNSLKMIAETDAEYEIEEFIDAGTISLDFFVINNELVWYRCLRQAFPLCNVHEYKPSTGYLIPKTDPLYAQGLEVVQKAIKALSPIYCNFGNIEGFETKDGIVFCELNYRRCGANHMAGYLYTEGYNGESLSIDLQWGQPIKLPKMDHEEPFKKYFCFFDFSLRPGKIVCKNALPKDLQSEMKMDWICKNGEEFAEMKMRIGSAGYGVISNESYEQLLKDIELLGEWNAYVME